jgi:hypothetical protein
MKLPPVEIAKKFVQSYYPKCDAAILAGSVVRGEYTATSDLDIIIFDSSISSSYRESLVEYEWRIEVFVHSFETYKPYWEQDIERGRPSLPRMLTEGVILVDHKILREIKDHSKTALLNGPSPWAEDTIYLKRYFITDLVDDLIGSKRYAETLYIANTLAERLHEFILRSNRQWIGSSKWIDRALREWDEQLADEFIQALNAVYKLDEKRKLIELAEKIVKPYGGFLFNGFNLGK